MIKTSKQLKAPNSINVDSMTDEELLAKLKRGHDDIEHGNTRPAKEVISGLDVRLGYAPNTDTLEAFTELDTGGGHTCKGSSSDLFADLLEN